MKDGYDVLICGVNIKPQEQLEVLKYAIENSLIINQSPFVEDGKTYLYKTQEINELVKA